MRQHLHPAKPHVKPSDSSCRVTFDMMSGIASAAIDKVRVSGNSCGGEVTCVVRCPPVGLGYPVFDKLEADLAKALMSLPATKVDLHPLWCLAHLDLSYSVLSQLVADRNGALVACLLQGLPQAACARPRVALSTCSRLASTFLALGWQASWLPDCLADQLIMSAVAVAQSCVAMLQRRHHHTLQGFEIGSGFAGSAMTGLEHNDEFEMRDGHVRTRTNRSGGVQGEHTLTRKR